MVSDVVGKSAPTPGPGSPPTGCRGTRAGLQAQVSWWRWEGDTAPRSCPPRAGRSLVPGHRVSRAHLRALDPAEPAVRAGRWLEITWSASRSHGGVRDPGIAEVWRAR